MYTDFDKNIKPEYIMLSDLKNYNKDFHEEYYYISGMEYEKEQKDPNRSKEEIKSEVKKEIKNETGLFLKESVKYFRIDKEKNKELVQKFNKAKQKINFNSVPKVLSNGKIYTYEFKNFTLYNDKLYKKELELQFENNIKSVAELDNKDLVILSENQINIYRLKNRKYSLLQKIDDYMSGYRTQMRFSGCLQYIKEYRCQEIIAISGNRFICISNYGYKIFELDEKNEYSVVFLTTYHETLTKIYELDKDNFIFFKKIYHGHSMGSPEHNELILEKVKISEKNGENNNSIEKEKEYNNENNHNNNENDNNNEKNDNDNNNENTNNIEYQELLKFFTECEDDNDNNDNNNDNINNNDNYNNDNDDDDSSQEEKKKEGEEMNDSNKYKCKYNKFFEFSQYYHCNNFRGDVLLKDKYLIVGIEHYILLFDISSGKLLRRYVLLYPGEENLYKQNVNISEWNKDKNEFITDIKGNIFMFKLTDDIELKIIGHVYFKEIKKIYKIGNKFYQFISKEAPKNSKYYYIEELYIYS